MFPTRAEEQSPRLLLNTVLTPPTIATTPYKINPLKKQDFVKTGAGNGSYLILTLRSPVTYEIANPANPDQVLGTYHVSALKDYQEHETERKNGFVAPLRKRGCPKKKLPPGSEPRRQRNQKGSL
ncbi:hypothetical protein TNCV_249101 [Trichonephila clavipes]|nr:hypothetical protein TNCV_249101 [Trichonephila clavipes]